MFHYYHHRANFSCLNWIKISFFNPSQKLVSSGVFRGSKLGHLVSKQSLFLRKDKFESFD